MEVRKGYKRTEVGVIPEDWEVVKLSDVIDSKRNIRYGIVQPGKFKMNGCLMLRSQDYSKGWSNSDEMHRVNETIETQYKNARLAKDDLIMTVVGAGIGQVVIAPDWLENAIVSRSTARIAVDKSKAIKEYVLSCLISPNGVRQILDVQKEGAQPVISCLDLAEFKIPYPPYKEQNALATALSDADALISGLEKLIEKKQAIKQGAMQELLRPKEGWEAKKLGEVCDFFSGGTPSTSVQSYYGGDIFWITSSDLNKTFINEVEGRITKMGLENSSAKMIKKGTLLVALYGATAGVTAISNVNAAINQAVLAIITKKDDTKFLYYQLSNLKNWIISTFIQGGQGNLSGNIFKDLVFEFPSLPKQTYISEVLSDMDAEISVLEQKLGKYKMIKQGMMQELLTGRVRLV